MPALTINGVDSETLGLTLGEAPSWLDMPSRDIPTAPIIGRQGATALADPLEQPRRVTLTGTMRATTPTVLRSKIDSVKLALAAKPLDLVFADNPTRKVTARLTNFVTKSVQSGSFVMEALSVEAQLTALDPYSYDIDPAGVLLWYQPGDTIAGESFTGPAGRTSIDANGVLQTAGANVKRDSHYIGGVRSLLLEGAGKNLCINSENMGAASWGLNGATRTAGQASPDGGTNAYRFDTTAVSQGPEESPVFTGNGEKIVYRFFRAGTAATQLFGLYDNTVSTYRHQVRITWTAGVPSLTTVLGAGTRFTPIALTGGWWLIAISATGVVAANAHRVLVLSEAGSVNWYMFGAQDEDSSFPTSYFKTTGAAATRAAESYSLPFPAPPQEMSIYAKIVESGTLAVNGAVADLSALVNANPQLILWAQGGFYQTRHHNGTAAVVSALAAAPAIGDAVELVGHLFADGSVDTIQSINAAASTVSTRSAALALPVAWSGQLAILNAAGGGALGFAAFRSFKIATRASRTLAEMQSLPRMPLGTAPVRPVITITGAAVNPVITLYNKAGIAVASITLTITTVGGDSLVIDMDAKTVKKNGVSQIATITAGDFFSVDPADQTNFGDPGPSIATSSGALTVDYRRAWR